MQPAIHHAPIGGAAGSGSGRPDALPAPLTNPVLRARLGRPLRLRWVIDEMDSHEADRKRSGSAQPVSILVRVRMQEVRLCCRTIHSDVEACLRLAI